MLNYLVSILILFSILILSGCSKKNPNFYEKIATADQLESQEYLVYPDKENSIITKNGIKIIIPAHTFESNSPVHLIFKEALNMYEITKAGLLTTTTDGKILSSEGMFFIDTREKLKMNKSINISVPTKTLKKDIKLFKGEKENETIHWEDPQDVSIKPLVSQEINGQKLFNKSCTSCHSIDKKMTGPALAFATSRQSIDWLIRYTRNWEEVIDPYACKMNLFDPSAMNKYPTLSDEEIIAIFKFIDSSTQELGLTENNAFVNLINCDEYFQKRDSLLLLADNLQKDNGKMIESNAVDVDTGILPKINNIAKSIQVPVNYADYYEVNINSPGWFNLDVLIDNLNSIDVTLKVKLKNKISDRVQVFLVIPSYKIFSEGGILTNTDEYSFWGDNASARLPENIPAYIFALGETKGTFFFDFSSFKTTKNSSILLDLKLFSIDQIKLEIAKMSLPDISFDIFESKNKSALENIDTYFKKYHDCDCFDPKIVNWVSSHGDTFHHEASCDCIYNAEK